MSDIKGDFFNISRGFLATDPEYPPTLAKKLRIRGITNDSSLPLLKNQTLELSTGIIRTVITIKRILREIIGKNIINKPRSLKAKSIGDIDIECFQTIAVEKYKTLAKFSRCVLIDKEKIVFAGMITDVLE